MKDFKLIAITLPDYVPDDANKIRHLLDAGFDRVHIRKPEWTAEQVSSLLDEIGPDYHEKITLHQTPELISERGYRVGFQLNSRHGLAPAGSVVVSKSCHSVEEATDASGDPRIAYQTLSPIYDSISKEGYVSAFNPEDLSDLPPNTIALGGVTPKHFENLRSLGFAGAAMLGYVWKCLENEPQSVSESFNIKLKS